MANSTACPELGPADGFTASDQHVADYLAGQERDVVLGVHNVAA